MSNVTLEGIAALLKEELHPIRETLAEHTKILSEHTNTLSQHTAVLEKLLTEKKSKTDKETVSAHRFDRLAGVYKLAKHN
jgi:hypothetical protein